MKSSSSKVIPLIDICSKGEKYIQSDGISNITEKAKLYVNITSLIGIDKNDSRLLSGLD